MARHQSVVTPEIARISMDCLDLSSLHGHESEEDIQRLCYLAITYHLRAVCVLPDKVRMASQFLKGTEVKLATIINFPDPNKRTQYDEFVNAETTAKDVAVAVASGANQIEIVQPRDVRPGYAQDIIRAARLACPQDVILTSILETASYKDTFDLADSALIAIASGADFLKTSTGCHPHGGASMEAAAILLQTIKQSQQAIGLQVSGEINGAEECAQYISLQRMFSGWGSVNPDRFSIVGHQVLNSLLLSLSLDVKRIVNSPETSANQRDFAMN